MQAHTDTGYHLYLSNESLARQTDGGLEGLSSVYIYIQTRILKHFLGGRRLYFGNRNEYDLLNFLFILETEMGMIC